MPKKLTFEPEKPLKVKPLNVMTSKIVHYGYTYPNVIINPSYVFKCRPILY
jgi:hypothetical protein